MSEEQQYKLGSYVNFMEASTQLLIEPVKGLQPKYTADDIEKYIVKQSNKRAIFCREHKDLFISLANLLYKIELDEKDVDVLTKSLKKNKDFLKSMNMKKREFDKDILHSVKECLVLKY